MFQDKLVEHSEYDGRHSLHKSEVSSGSKAVDQRAFGVNSPPQYCCQQNTIATKFQRITELV